MIRQLIYNLIKRYDIYFAHLLFCIIAVFNFEKVLQGIKARLCKF